VTTYTNVELIFCNIENIHVMRNSANLLSEAFLAQQNIHASTKEVLAGDLNSVGFYTKLEESGWMRHLQLIMIAGVLAAEKLHFEASSVLVHCSDGWFYFIIFGVLAYKIMI
jgi:hypothetical protein